MLNGMVFIQIYAKNGMVLNTIIYNYFNFK